MDTCLKCKSVLTKAEEKSNTLHCTACIEKALKHPDFAMPDNLSKTGQKAYHTIMTFLAKEGLVFTGGCKAFYSPKEWKERGSVCGLTSELIVVHDGGDLATIINQDYGNCNLNDRFTKHLSTAGVYHEPCTCWYASIHKE